MVVKYITPGGSRIHEPPYTEAEEADFYRRIGGGPVTVARPAADKTTDNKSAKKRSEENATLTPSGSAIKRGVKRGR